MSVIVYVGTTYGLGIYSIEMPMYIDKTTCKKYSLQHNL